MIKNKLTDIEIINLLRKRDSHVFKLIIERYFNQIKEFVIKHNGNTEDAQDVFQDALIQVLEIIDNDSTADFDIENLLVKRASLLWINQMKNRLQLSTNKIQLESLSDQPNENIADIIQNYLIQLKPEILMALFMYYQDISYKEIAKKLGWEDAVLTKNRINAAKSKLKKVIKESDDYKSLVLEQTSEKQV